MDAENLAPTGIRSPDRPARSESLYRLSYPGPLFIKGRYLTKHVGNIAFLYLDLCQFYSLSFLFLHRYTDIKQNSTIKCSDANNNKEDRKILRAIKRGKAY